MTHAPRPQQTIAQSAAVSGFGYWSGRDVTVEFRPAPVDSGIVFVRCDLPTPARIPALLAQRREVPRRTVLSAQGASVEMVEHILAALAGLQIDNCEIWVNAAEMPGCDGSSEPLAAALAAAGLVEQTAHRARLIVTERIRVGDDDAWVEARPLPGASSMRLKYRLDYGSDSAVGRQSLEIDVTPQSFRRELAPARTFVLLEEAEWLRAQGLGTRAGYRDLLIFGPDGPIDNELRFDNECVRHKALDMVGDLALAGCDLAGHFIAYRSGHRLNAELVRALLQEGAWSEPRRKTA